MWIQIAFFCLIGIGLSGCVDSPNPEPPIPGPEFGLGLRWIEWPQPAAFLEGEDNITEVGEFIFDLLADFTASHCGPEYNFPYPNETAARQTQLYFAFFLDTMHACGAASLPESKSKAREWHRDGVAEEQFAALQDDYANIEQRNIDAFHAKSWPHEAAFEFAGALSSIGSNALSFGVQAEEGFNRYVLEPNHERLWKAVNDLDIAILWREVIQAAITVYPERNTACTLADVPQAVSDLQAIMESLQVIADEQWDEDERRYVNSRAGALYRTYIPAATFVISHDIEPGIFNSLVGRHWTLAAWELIGTSPLPTQEEASYLVAKYVSEQRTLATDFRLGPIVNTIADARDWSRYSNVAEEVLALDALQPRLDLLECGSRV